MGNEAVESGSISMVLGAGQRWTSVNLGWASSSLLIIVTQCAHEPPNPNLTSSLGAKFRTTPGCSRPRPWNKLKTTRMRYGSPEYYPGSYLNPGQSRFTREMARVRASRTGLLTSSRLECPIGGPCAVITALNAPNRSLEASFLVLCLPKWHIWSFFASYARLL